MVPLPLLRDESVMHQVHCAPNANNGELLEVCLWHITMRLLFAANVTRLHAAGGRGAVEGTRSTEAQDPVYGCSCCLLPQSEIPESPGPKQCQASLTIKLQSREHPACCLTVHAAGGRGAQGVSCGTHAQGTLCGFLAAC